MTVSAFHFDGPPQRSFLERFMIRVKPESAAGCWIWTGATNFSGYGVCAIRRVDGRYKAAMAHRVSYELLVGPIPEGLHLDHLCRNPPCVNPDHLEPVTIAENNRRGEPFRAPRITHCANGHEFTEENTLRRRGQVRVCRTCNKIHQQKYKRRTRGPLRRPQVEQAIAEVLTANGTLRSCEVARLLPQFKTQSVYTDLWRLADIGKIERVGYGLYAAKPEDGVSRLVTA